MSADVDLARDLARATGELLVDVRPGLFAQGLATGDIKDAGDGVAQEFLARALAEHRPDDAVLSEEAEDDLIRLDADRVWIIDPLDGTREFAREGRLDWAVHVALWERTANSITAAAVSLPAQGVIIDTYRTPAPPERPVTGALRVVVSASRTPKVLDLLAARFDLEIELWGSAGAKAALVINGEVDAYVHDTELNEWDAAAPVGVAQAVGLHVSHLDGSPMTFNERIPVFGDILMCRADLADGLLAALAAGR